MNKRIKRETETSCEYILPDYMGDIKKILSSKAKCIPGGKFVSDGTLEATGAVEYEIIYADSENKLTAISATSDYSVKTPADEECYVNAAVCDRVANLGIRVTGPRKMSLKAAVESDMTVTLSAAAEVSGDVFSSEKEAEKSTRVINIENNLYGKTLEREYAEEAERLSGVGGEDVEIIGVGGSVRITESSAVEGGAEVKGEVIIVAIVKTPEQPPFRITKSIPFSEVIEIEGATEDMIIVPTACISSAMIGSSDDGEDKVLVANAIAELSAYAVVNEPFEVVTDAYLTDAKTKNEYSDFEYTTVKEITKKEISVDTKVSAESIEGVELQDVIYTNAEVRDIECGVNEKSARVIGNIAFSAIACEINADNSISYIPIKATVPFEENVNISCHISDKTAVKCNVVAVESEALIAADGIELKCVGSITVTALESDSVRVLNACSTSSELDEIDATSITVYYPVPEDTLFSVAKRYHKSVAKVAADNSLTDAVSTADMQGSLAGVKKMFII